MSTRRTSGYERKPRDFYPTPQWVTQALTENVIFHQHIWEPACGQGHMSMALEDAGYVVKSTDIEPNYQGAETLDFIESIDSHPAVVTNPPFNLADAFIRRALAATERYSGKVAMLLSTDFYHSSRRFDLFGGCPQFSVKLVLTSRIKWFEGTADDKGKQPMNNHAWFVWDWKQNGPSETLFHYRSSR